MLSSVRLLGGYADLIILCLFNKLIDKLCINFMLMIHILFQSNFRLSDFFTQNCNPAFMLPYSTDKSEQVE